MNKHYEHHIKHFLAFIPERPHTLKIMLLYYDYVNETSMSKSTARSRISAAWDYIRADTDEKKFRQAKAELNYLYPPKGAPSVRAYRVTDEEYRKLLEVASERMQLMIRVMREHPELRISAILDMELYDQRISEDFRKEVLQIYPSQRWLFESKNNKQYKRFYPSNRIKEYGIRALGKDYISAESLR